MRISLRCRAMSQDVHSAVAVQQAAHEVDEVRGRDGHTSERQALRWPDTEIEQPVVQDRVTERGPIGPPSTPRPNWDDSYIFTLDTAQVDLDQHKVFAVERDMPTIARETAVSRRKANRVGELGGPRDCSADCASLRLVARPPTRSSIPRDARIGRSREPLRPVLSYARIYAQDRTLVLSHECVLCLLFHATRRSEGRSQRRAVLTYQSSAFQKRSRGSLIGAILRPCTRRACA